MLSQSGIPVIYSGDEIGQVNDYSYKDDPENPMIHVIFTEENSTGSWLKTVMILLLYRANFSLCLINWSISVQATVYSTVMFQFAPLTPGILLFLLLYVRIIRRNLSVSTTSVRMIKLHGSMKKMVCTQILSPDERWKPGVCRFRHSDVTGCAEINNNF